MIRPLLVVLLALSACADATSFKDADGDGWPFDAGDCDDADPDIHPGAIELPDGVDQDCDEVVDEGTTARDDDLDGYAEESGDCDDALATVHPGAAEGIDCVDQDCDGAIDEGTSAVDDDGDGFAEVEPGGSCPAWATGGDCDDGDPLVAPGAEERPDDIDDDCDGVIDEGTARYDDDGDGWTEEEGDCDDAAADLSPDTPEVADGVDEDCDGVVDEGTEAFDDDGDGYTEVDGDCDDADEHVSPGNTETWDYHDEDCDGLLDDGTAGADDDGDGWAEAWGDCDDADATVHPYRAETADGRDEDCDGVVDEGTDAYDDDLDGWTEGEGDCDDTSVLVHPYAPESCDGIDEDCDGVVDDVDTDGDGYLAASCGGDDCNDTRSDVNPGATESEVDAVDNDCDGDTDERLDDAEGVTGADDAPVDLSLSPAEGSIDCLRDYADREAVVPVSPGVTLATKVVMVNSGAGAGGSTSDVLSAIAVASDFFREAGIEFAPTIESLNSDVYTSLSGEAEENELAALYAGDAGSSVLIFVVNTLEEGTLNGKAHPRNSTWSYANPAVFIDQDRLAAPSTTLVHELGHYFGLVHTHETAWGVGAVDGSDCDVEGDVVCETPADPGRGACSTNAATCTLACAGADENGDPWRPDIGDIMSYYPDECNDDALKAEQARVIACTYENYLGGIDLVGGAGTGEGGFWVADEYLEVAPDAVASTTIAIPEDRGACSPFVTLERIAEHGDPSGGDDQCDVHTSVTDVGGSYTFLVQAEHCGDNWGDGYGVVAHVAVFCPGESGLAVTGALRAEGGSGDSASLGYSTEGVGEIAAVCAGFGIDAQGGKDADLVCSTSLSGSGAVFSLAGSECMGDAGYFADAYWALLGVSDGEALEVQEFDNDATLVHVYGSETGEQHLAFVLPQSLNDDCGPDELNYTSSCTDDGSAVTCSISVGDDVDVRGQVLFLDGDFPAASSLR